LKKHLLPVSICFFWQIVWALTLLYVYFAHWPNFVIDTDQE